MATEISPALNSSAQPKWMTITGWVITALIAGGLLFSASMKFMQPADMLKEWAKFGIDAKLLVPIGVLEVSCLLVYLFPRTAILGAILLTGYVGGAIMTHLRVNDNFAPPIIMGVLLWLGIFLREPRLRAIMPLR